MIRNIKFGLFLSFGPKILNEGETKGECTQSGKKMARFPIGGITNPLATWQLGNLTRKERVPSNEGEGDLDL